MADVPEGHRTHSKVKYRYLRFERQPISVIWIVWIFKLPIASTLMHPHTIREADF